MNRTELLNSFRLAMLTDSVYLCYQPQFNHVTGKMVGAEALMRWHDDKHGDQYPSDFIPVLEESGYMHDADLHVFEMICMFLRRCLDENIPLVPISFNISRFDIYHHNYVEEIEEIRKKYEIPVALLRAEITESSAIGGVDLVVTVLQDLHHYGYTVEMDDFGHGYSSLNILKDLPVDIIKLDMRFLSGVVESRGGLILNSVVQLSKWLNTPLIAEGVETSIQADFMKSLGCNYMQGYLYSKPLKEDDFVELLKKNSLEVIENERVTPSLLDVYRFFDPDSVETAFFNTYVGPAAICIFDKNGISVVNANDKYYEELSIHNHSTSAIKDVYAYENHKLFEKAIEQCKESGKEAICDTWIRIDNGMCGISEICIRNHVSVLSEIEGKCILFLTVRDVTQEKKMIEELRQSETKFRYASEHTNTYAWEYDIITKCMYPCSRCQRDLGMPDVVENYPEPVIGTLFPLDYADLYRSWHKQLENGVPHLEAVIPLTKDRIPFKVEYTTVFDEAGRPSKAYGSATLENAVMFTAQTISDIAYIMAQMHVAVYEVDLATDDFIVFYSSIENKNAIGDIANGKNFFSFIEGKIVENLMEKDKERVVKETRRSRVIDTLERYGSYRYMYRFRKTNKIRYAQMKIVYLNEDKEKIVAIVDDMTSAVEDRNAYLEVKSDNSIYTHMMNALAKDYVHLYYVDLETDEFTEYRQSVGNMNFVRKGVDFFNQGMKDAVLKIHSDDIEMFKHEFDKELIVSELKKGQTFTLNYRLLVDGSYIYASMKISSLDGHKMIVGVSDVTRQMLYSEKIKKMEEERLIYSRFFALTGNFICMYIVENDGSYVEYHSSESNVGLDVPKKGKNFFVEFLRKTKKIAVIEDWPYILRNVDEKRIREDIKNKGFSEIEYRLVIHGKPTYVNLKTVKVEDATGSHLVVGLNDVDREVRAKQKYDLDLLEANTRANIDVLTGVRNKYAYLDMEEVLNEQIAQSKQSEFGLAVFDVNGLKNVNDKFGASVGDKYLQDACKTICGVFDHSPIFRVGGDEFVAILRGTDYECAQQLYDELQKCNEKNEKSGKATIACGIARYAGDSYVSDVFTRADKQMRLNKCAFRFPQEEKG